MSQCVPSWDVDDDSSRSRRKTELHAPSTLDVPTVDYEVSELTWKNGQLAMHGLGPRRVLNKPQSTISALTKYAWDKPRAAETLEAIVHQATVKPHRKTQTAMSGDELVPWLDRRAAPVAVGSVGASATTTLDALVPSANDSLQSAYFSTLVGSCSGGPAAFEERRGARGGGAASLVEEQRAARGELSSNREHSASGSGMDSSRRVTWERELGVKGFTSTSMGSPENTSSGQRCTKSTSPDEHDSVYHSISQRETRETSDGEEKKKEKRKTSVLGKKGRAAAVHNQSERKRRDKINQKMKTLQKLVPNASKTDKASMLDEVIEYLKQLQAQIGMMSRMSMPSMMMMPLAMQQQLQMAMMNPMMGMGMGMGMGMTMDLNSIGGGFHPSSFMAMHAGDRAPNNIDTMSTFLACQSQPMTMDAYSRMAAMFQQMQNQSGLNN